MENITYEEIFELGVRNNCEVPQCMDLKINSRQVEELESMKLSRYMEGHKSFTIIEICDTLHASMYRKCVLIHILFFLSHDWLLLIHQDQVKM